MTSQEEFSERLKRFDESENKGRYYFMFLNMIEKGFKTEAFLFILSTWNFATFRYAMKNFDLNSFKEIVKNLKPYFERFNGQDIKDINFDEYKKEIKHIFQELSEIKGIQFTGGFKVNALNNSGSFCYAGWMYWGSVGLQEGGSEDSFNFLKKNVKFTFPSLEKNRKNKMKKEFQFF